VSSQLWITGDDEADALLSSDPFALLVGMLLDQQVAMETAFAGPAKIRERLGGLEPNALAEHDAEGLVGVFRQPPAVHRYPGSMAERVQALAAVVAGEWGGDASAIWTRDDPDGAEVLRRLKALPGFGDQKARIFVALLGKQYGFSGEGWRDAAGGYGEDGVFRSVADITSAETLGKVREYKRAAKAAAKGASKGGA
jgi:uncharacterized HhH-GPD family protein